MSNKKTIFFGSGAVAEKSLKLKPAFIVDNNKDLQGNLFHGLEVKSPESIRGLAKEYSVVVCSSSLDAIRPQLEDLGYVWGSDVVVAELLKENLAVDKLERERFSFILSSGLPSHVKETHGGGVFHIQETEGFPVIMKIFEGNVHGLIKCDDGYVFNAQGDGIYKIAPSTFEVQKLINVPKGLRPHGISRCSLGWLIVSSYEDALIVLSDNGEEVKRFPLSSKHSRFGTAQHHCNDVTVFENFAYVSMFSLTGNWKRGRFDGGIIEIDLETGDRNIVAQDLLMPHNVSVFEGELRVLDSFRGRILLRNFETFGTLPGFVRGLFEDHEYIYVGESKNRNFSRLSSGRRPVSIDTKITVIDKVVGICRSISLPRGISEIHSIIKV